MTFKPAVWYPIAIALSVFNLIAVGFTAGPDQPWHAAGHAALALAFGLWAQHLRRGSRPSPELPTRLDALEGELTRLRQELSETQERLDFAERLLTQGREARGGTPQR
jgi:hypothetical protein